MKIKILCVVAALLLIYDCFPLGATGFLYKLSCYASDVHNAVILFYGLVAISSFYILSKKLTFIWSVIIGALFTFLSIDYWELPFPWVAPPAEGTLYFILRWRLFPVLVLIMIFFIFFKYDWSFWKYVALTLPGWSYVFVFPIMEQVYSGIKDCYVPYVGWLSPGAFKYMPNRAIPTIFLGWVLLNGEPSKFFKQLGGVKHDK